MSTALAFKGLNVSKVAISRSLIDYVAREDSDLHTLLRQLWLVSATLHNDQNDGNGTENGRIHVEKVAENAWRLITQSPTKSCSDFQPSEVFLLSAGSCCHDFGKALRKYRPSDFPHASFTHGVQAGDFVAANYDRLGFANKEALADSVCELCSIHDLNGEDFTAKIETLEVHTPTDGNPINMHLLAVLVKAADILHTDQSRVNTLGMDVSGLIGIERSKYLARRSIRGWKINGDTVVIEATPKDKHEEKAVRDCECYMVDSEWPDVGAILKPYGFAHNLQFHIQRKTRGVVIMPDGPGELIIAARKRHLRLSIAKSALYSVVKSFRDGELCRNEYVLHAAGTAIASLATQTIFEKIDYMVTDLEKRAFDMLGEVDHSATKLKENIQFLIPIRSELKQVLDMSAAELEETQKEATRKSRRVNTINRVFRVLPGGADILDIKLHNILNTLQNEIEKLEGLLLKISHRIQKLPPKKRDSARIDPKRYQEIIRPALQAAATRLNDLKEDLRLELKDVATMKASFDEDWTNDFFDIKRSEECETG